MDYTQYPSRNGRSKPFIKIEGLVTKTETDARTRYAAEDGLKQLGLKLRLHSYTSQGMLGYTRSMLTTGHRHYFDINVPLIFPNF